MKFHLYSQMTNGLAFGLLVQVLMKQSSSYMELANGPCQVWSYACLQRLNLSPNYHFIFLKELMINMAVAGDRLKDCS